MPRKSEKINWMSGNVHYYWAIFTINKQKAKKVVAQILEEQNNKNVKVIKANLDKNLTEIWFEDGNHLIWIGHTDNFKGFRFHHLWCDKNINQEYLEQVILPMACYMKYEDIVWI